jgi:hypothetical protein
MACRLTIIGDFNPEELLSAYGIDLPPERIWQKGEILTKDRICETSGIQFFVSKAPRDDYRRQFKEAAAFLWVNKQWLRVITKDPRVAEGCLDFGLAQDHHLAYYRRLPLNLIQMAAVCSVEIELSFYAVTGKSEDISQHAKTPEESGETEKTGADNGS